MIVKCPKCNTQYDDTTFDKCPTCEETAENASIIQSSSISYSPIKIQKYENIAKGLKTFAVIIFILTVIAAIIVGNTIAKVEVSSLYSTHTRTTATPIIVTLVSGAIAGIFTLILSWIFDGISDILKK